MSYICDNCGKNGVSQYGNWCSECQEREEDAHRENDGRWYSQSALCQSCIYARGPDSSDQCGYYKMPLYMTARKRKCKHYESNDGFWIPEIF